MWNIKHLQSSRSKVVLNLNWCFYNDSESKTFLKDKVHPMFFLTWLMQRNSASSFSRFSFFSPLCFVQRRIWLWLASLFCPLFSCIAKHLFSDAISDNCVRLKRKVLLINPCFVRLRMCQTKFSFNFWCQLVPQFLV